VTEKISSAANPLVKRMRLLADRRHRRREGAFVVEGGQPVWRAIEAGWEIEVLVVAPELIGGPAAKMVAEQEARGTRVAHLSRELFERLSDRDGPAGLAAIVRGSAAGLETLTVRPESLFVALHEIGNPGNLGTVVRTADAVGASGVVLVGDTTDPLGPAAVKASMGSIFAVDVVHAPDLDAFFAWAGRLGVRVLATSGRAEAAHWDTDTDYSTPAVVLMGSEGAGLPEATLGRADLWVRIPMTGTAESLNLAVATGVLLYEARRHAVASSGGVARRRLGDGQAC
jgi:RNA methyltransferase, TrmH family